MHGAPHACGPPPGQNTPSVQRQPHASCPRTPEVPEVTLSAAPLAVEDVPRHEYTFHVNACRAPPQVPSLWRVAAYAPNGELRCDGAAAGDGTGGAPKSCCRLSLYKLLTGKNESPAADMGRAERPAKDRQEPCTFKGFFSRGRHGSAAQATTRLCWRAPNGPVHLNASAPASPPHDSSGSCTNARPGHEADCAGRSSGASVCGPCCQQACLVREPRPSGRHATHQLQGEARRRRRLAAGGSQQGLQP